MLCYAVKVLYDAVPVLCDAVPVLRDAVLNVCGMMKRLYWSGVAPVNIARAALRTSLRRGGTSV